MILSSVKNNTLSVKLTLPILLCTYLGKQMGFTIKNKALIILVVAVRAAFPYGSCKS